MDMGTLKIGVIMDPIEKIDIDKDTTFVLMLEAQKRGHELYYMELDDLSRSHELPGDRQPDLARPEVYRGARGPFRDREHGQLANREQGPVAQENMDQRTFPGGDLVVQEHVITFPEGEWLSERDPRDRGIAAQRGHDAHAPGPFRGCMSWHTEHESE